METEEAQEMAPMPGKRLPHDWALTCDKELLNHEEVIFVLWERRLGSFRGEWRELSDVCRRRPRQPPCQRSGRGRRGAHGCPGGPVSRFCPPAAQQRGQRYYWDISLHILIVLTWVLSSFLHWSSGSMVIEWLACLPNSPRLGFKSQLPPSSLAVVCSPCAYVGFLPVLRLPLMAPKHDSGH